MANPVNPDLPAIKKLFTDSGRKLKTWARVKGLNPDTFDAFMQGRFNPPTGGPVRDSFVAALKADKLWVAQKKQH